MTGNQKTACLILLILAITGGRLSYSYIKTVRDVELQKFDNQRLMVLVDIMIKILHNNPTNQPAKCPVTRHINKNSANNYTELLQQPANADEVMIIYSNGDKIKFFQNGIQQFIGDPDQKVEHQNRSISVKIDSIKRSSHKLTLKCHEVGSQNLFLSYVDLRFVDPNEVFLLFDAFKKASIVKVQGNFKLRDGIIERANISSVTG